MSEHIRRVASPEGAQYYGLPIGAPITPDAKAKAKAMHGGSEPMGASKAAKNKGGSAAAAVNAKAATEQAAKAAGKAKPQQSKTKLKKPTIKGNMHFKVGSTDYTAPNGSLLFKQKGVDGLAYVKTPDGKVHIFNENGEVETDSTAVLQALSQKFSQDIADDDPDFEPAEFDKVGSHYSLDQIPTGGVLTDQRGNPVFTKNEDGTWHNEDLGVDLDEKSVAPLFDSGDLIPEKNDTSEALSTALADKEAVNFSELSMAEAVESLDAMPEGTSLQAADFVFTKQADGWTFPGSEQEPVSSTTLGYVKNELKPADGVDVTPDMAEDPKGAPAPKNPSVPGPPAPPALKPEPTERAAASKQAIADANPYKPKPVDFTMVYPEDEQYPKQITKPQDLTDAQPGDTMLVTYYADDNEFESPDVSDYYDIAVFTKQDDGSWWDQESIQKLSPEDMDSLVKDPEVKVFPNKDNVGRPQPKPVEKPKPPVAAKKEQEPAPKMVKGGGINVPLEDLEVGHKVALKYNGKGTGLPYNLFYTKVDDNKWHQDGDPSSFGDKDDQWLKSQKNKSTTLVHEAYPDASAPAVEETPDVKPETPKSWASLQSGDTATGEWSKNVGMGSQVSVSQGKSSVVYTKSAFNTWAGGNISLNEEQMAYALEKINTSDSDYSTTSVLTTNKKKTLKVTVEDIPDDDIVNDHTTVGGKPESVDHLKEYPAATTLLYTKKDGSKSTYTKLETGQYLTPNGQVIAPESLKNAVNQGKFEVGSVPAAPQTVEVEGLDEKYLTPGTPIDKFGVLKQYPDGTVLHATAVGYQQAKTPLVITKTDGTWTDNYGDVYGPDDFEGDIKHEGLYFHSVPQEKLSPEEALTAVSTGDYKTSTVPNLTFDSTGQAYSSKDVKGALDAFENFSGFQLKYAFKGDDKQNPLAEQTESIKAWAKTAYPDLPPKAGAIKLFKEKLGLDSTEDTEEKNSSNGAPNISFGDGGDNIKSTATGFTGGEFNDQDVQEAINILESFSGKAFKNELNKKGNPLGTLSPNHLVGFDKDKTVTKQKFIDLMKEKLKNYDASKVEEGGPTVDPSKVEEGGPEVEPLADWEKELLGIPSFVPGNVVTSSDSADYENAPVGTVLQENEHLSYIKQADGSWEATNWEKTVLNNKDLSDFKPAEGYLVVEPNLDQADAPTELDASLSETQTPVTSFEQLDALPAGSKIKNSYGYEFTKMSTGLWDDEGISYEATELMSSVDLKYVITHVPAQETPVDTETPLTKDDITSAPVGSVVTWHSTEGFASSDYTKVGDNAWNTDQLEGATLTDSDVQKGISSKSHYTWSSTPNTLPSYANTPNAVKDKSHDEASNLPDVDNAPVGQVYEHTDGNLMYVKDLDGEWYAYSKESGNVEFAVSPQGLKSGIDSGEIQDVKYDGPDYNKSGLMPGKYSSGAAAYMVVHADGTGVYVNGKGVASKLTSYKVKKNHESGMNYYQGIPSEVPSVPETPKTGSKAKPAKIGDAHLPDGTYFIGSPSDKKSSVVHIEGDKATIQKPIGSTSGSPKKIGQDANGEWANAAALGAQVKGQGNVYGWKTGKVYTKTTDGWKNTDGDLLDKSDWGGSDWPWAYGTIQSHGFNTAEESTKAKVQAQAKKGQITDKYGNSIVPEGYTGPVMFFGSKTSIPSLVKFQEALSSDSLSQNEDIKKLGIYIPSGLATQYLNDHFGEVTADSKKQGLQQKVSELLQGLDTDLPDSDAADLFEYNGLGQPILPAAAASSVTFSTADQKKQVKEIGSTFGGGGIIGQHTDGMGSYEVSNWLNAFTTGDFKKMYDIEVNAAAAKGNSHIAGFKHPGYEGNTETNKIAWAPAVEGEVSALENIPGNWTPAYGDVPMAEVDNYLIQAQMQNPTFLSSEEKRSWVKFHRLDLKASVDALSLKAKKRKDEGTAPLTDEPNFTADLKPAKSYDILFEDKVLFPTSWNSQQASDYLNDHLEGDSEEDEKMTAAYSTWQKENPYAYSNAPFLNEYYQGKLDEQAAQALIPVYSKSPNQTVKKSTHPIYDYHDQHGTHYFFKPRPDTQEDKYRTEVEHLGNSLGRALGFKTAKSDLLTLDGKYGQMQEDVSGVSDFSGFNFKTLTTKQIADIEGEHLLDYFMNNDDAKYDNAKIQADGSVIGIDKARSFGFYGQWDWEGPAADGNTTIYQNMYSAIRSGAFSKEDLDKAYLKARQSATRISNFNEDRLRDMMTEGMKNRSTYNVPYSIDGKKVSQDFDGLMAAVMDRKSKMPEIFDEKWQKLYADAGLGELPDPKKSGPEGLVTGLQSDDAHEKMFQAKVAGITTQLSGAHVIGGTAHLWTDKYADGSTNMHGEMYLGPKMQETLNSYFTANAVDASGGSSAKSVVAGFESVNAPVDQKFLAAVKTINAHVGDSSYNEATMAAFKAQVDTLKADNAEWNPSLTSNTSLPGGEEGYKFKSGTTLSMQHLDQYKLMSDSYLEKSAPLLEAYYSKTTTGQYEPYKPVKVNPKASFFTKTDGSTATPLNGSEFLIKDASTGKVSVGALNGEWTEVIPEVKGTLGENSGIKVTKRAFTHEQAATWENGVKTAVPGSQAGNGSKGTEWEIELPTGEKIHYRNSGLTNTAQAQHGKLVFTAEGVENENDSQAAMSHIMDQLNTLGISTEAQTETDAELTYWREMYGILASRNHSKQSDKRYAAAEKDMWAKQAEIGGDKNHFLETLDEKMAPEEQAEFWRSLWAKHFGQDKVNDLIDNRKYIPEFAHQDYDQPDLATGKPHFYRFDVDMDSLMKNDWMLATSTGGDPWERFKSGGLLSAEERLRQLDLFMGAGGGYNTAYQDQANGGSHYIYTRLQNTSYTGANVIYSPRVMLKTRVASFDGDVYGNVNKRKDRAPSDPLHTTKKHSGWIGGSNETDIPHSATLLDDVEILSFDNPAKLNEAIQALKKRGIDEIRGVPIEDRLVMHSNMAKAIAKMKARWAKGEY